jgi:hypothetical protein
MIIQHNFLFWTLMKVKGFQLLIDLRYHFEKTIAFMIIFVEEFSLWTHFSFVVVIFMNEYQGVSMVTNFF